MKIKIALVAGAPEIGGTEKQVINISENLNRIGIDSTPVFLFGSSDENLTKFFEKSVHFNLNFKKPLFLPIQIWKIGKFLKKEDFKIIQIFLLKNFLVVLLIKYIFKINPKMIFSVRGVNIRQTKAYNLLFKLALLKSDLILCNSYFLKDYVLQFKPKTQIRVVKNGIDLPLNFSKLNSETTNLIMISNHHQYKGFDKLIEIVPHIKYQCILTIYGSGPKFNYHKELFDNLHGLVEVRLVPNMEISNELFRNFHFGIHPSLTEGSSNAILEELVNGIPVVAFNTGGNSELITDNVNGFLVENFNILYFAEKINLLIRDIDLRDELSKNARQVIKHHNWDKICEEYLDIYRVILEL